MKRFFSICFCLLLVFLLISCEGYGIKVAEVLFDSDGGSSIDSIFVRIGKTVPEPKSPTKKGFDFVGWQLNGDSFSFDTPINADIILKAVWTESIVEPKEISLGVATSKDNDIVLDFGEKNNSEIVKAIVSDSLLGDREEVIRNNVFEIECASGFDRLDFKLKYFGIHDIRIEYYNSSNEVVAFSNFNVTTKAKHYNIVMMNATLPVTHVALELVGPLKGQNNIVALERAGAFDWDNLPNGTVDCPFAEEEKIRGSVVSGNNYFFELCDAMDRYIEYLHYIDKDSTFSLYVTDNYPELILKLLYDNGISETQSKIYMVTDGTGTYSIFSQTFPSSMTENDLKTKFDNMKTDWDAWKNKALNGDLSYIDDISQKIGRGYQMLQDYPAVIVQDDNVEWWVGRKNVDVLSCAYIFNTYLKDQSRVIARNLNSLLTALNKDSQSDLLNFLYFNENMFAEAYQKGKKVMLFIGTRNDVTEAFHLRDYLTLIKNYYGEDYAYYYKGHPGDPTDLNPTRKDLLDELKVTDVESSIAAELIYFFNPGIDLCGYPSSTYNIVPDEYEIPFIMYSGSQNNTVFNGQEYKINVNKTIGFDSVNKCYKILFEKGCDISEDISYGTWNAENQKFEIKYFNEEGTEIK